jgi:hypothetical protein
MNKVRAKTQHLHRDDKYVRLEKRGEVKAKWLL